MTTRAGSVVVGTATAYKSGTETTPTRSDNASVISDSPDNATNAPQVPPGSMEFG